MFDPNNFRAIENWEAGDLSGLPEEDDRHEYKSGLTLDKALAEKIEHAASGFWNSGGGLFVAGVGGDGRPDGGISQSVGRQSRLDWIDQSVSRVTPKARYAVHCVAGGPAVPEGRVVALIGFAPSEAGPHMAGDNRFYLRAGAHTVRAGQFLVEAMFARRHHHKPRLIHVLDLRQYTSATSSLTVDIISLTPAPALDVELTLAGMPTDLKLSLPLKTTLIDATHGFSFRFDVPREGFSGNLKVQYSDLAGSRYTYEADIHTRDCLPSWHRGVDHLGEIARSLDGIRSHLDRK